MQGFFLGKFPCFFTGKATVKWGNPRCFPKLILMNFTPKQLF